MCVWQPPISLPFLDVLSFLRLNGSLLVTLLLNIQNPRVEVVIWRLSLFHCLLASAASNEKSATKWSALCGSFFSDSFYKFLFTFDVLRFPPKMTRLILAYSIIQFFSQSGNGAVEFLTESNIFTFVLSLYRVLGRRHPVFSSDLLCFLSFKGRKGRKKER